MDSSLTKTCWSDIKSTVKKANPTVFGLIEDINPSDDMPLYIAEYPYGTIIDDGIFYYPDENGVLRPRSDPGLPQGVRDDFEYAGENTPLGMVLDKTIENFATTNQGVSPWDIYRPGDFFAMSISLENTMQFVPLEALHMSSGVRSIYLLPNIGNFSSHNKIQIKYVLGESAPKELSGQWSLFSQLAMKAKEVEKWRSKIVLFSTQWMEELKNNIRWSKFLVYLYKKNTQRTAFACNQKFYEIAFSKAQANRNLKPNPYLADTAKHLLSILAGGSPAFRVALDDQSAPIDLLTKIYKEVYGCKYSPIFFVPEYFRYMQCDQPIYYSMQLPTTFEYSPSSRKVSTQLSDLKELKNILDKCKNEILITQKMHRTAVVELFESVEFLFFHNKIDRLDEIKLTSEIPNFDPGLNSLCDSEYPFSKDGAFLRGCIMIKRK